MLGLFYLTIFIGMCLLCVGGVLWSWHKEMENEYPGR
jgi:hypothetical protein